MGWGSEDYLSFARSPLPTPTFHSNSKSNMAGRINDRELITLARPNKTPALQDKLLLMEHLFLSIVTFVPGPQELSFLSTRIREKMLQSSILFSTLSKVLLLINLLSRFRCSTPSSFFACVN